MKIIEQNIHFLNFFTLKCNRDRQDVPFISTENLLVQAR